MSRVKIKLDDWSDAELDLISAKSIASVLSEALFSEGYHREESEVAYAIHRLIESALEKIENGTKRDRDE